VQSYNSACQFRITSIQTNNINCPGGPAARSTTGSRFSGATPPRI
jgi:hypothetical protein